MYHSPFDQPSYKKAKKKRVAKKAPARKKAKKVTKKRPVRKAKKKVAKKATPKTKRKSKRRIPRIHPKKIGTWALTHMPTGIAATRYVKTKKALRQLVLDLGSIRGSRWGSLSVAEIKGRKKWPKWFSEAAGITRKVRNNPNVDPGWSGRGAGARRWVKEDIIINTSDGLAVIEGEVLYPDRIWGINRTSAEATRKNPPIQQILMFGKRR